MWLEIEKLETCFKYDLQETCVNDAQIMKKAPVQRPSRKKVTCILGVGILCNSQNSELRTSNDRSMREQT